MEKLKNRISILGLGYMGLPLACLLARAGFDVTGVDIDLNKVDSLQRNECPFQELGLPEFLASALFTGKLTFSYKNIPKSDTYIIAVPTPAEGKKANLRYVEAAAEMISEVLGEDELVILESTVPPKTCRDLLRPIFDKKGIRYFLSHIPERALPGNTLYELQYNDRIIGTEDEESAALSKNVYASFVKGNIFFTDLITAEVAKLIENSYRDINIAFANYLLKISEEVGFNPWEAIYFANKHPRVNILNPGAGVGGHCIPIDPWFLIENVEDKGLISISREINDSMPGYWVRKLKEFCLEKNIIGKNVGIFGVSYKPNVDDVRESPASKIIELLKADGYEIKIFDPLVKNYFLPIEKSESVIIWANVIMIVTAHSGFEKYKLLDNVLDCNGAEKA